MTFIRTLRWRQQKAKERDYLIFHISNNIEKVCTHKKFQTVLWTQEPESGPKDGSDKEKPLENLIKVVLYH